MDSLMFGQVSAPHQMPLSGRRHGVPADSFKMDIYGSSPGVIASSPTALLEQLFHANMSLQSSQKVRALADLEATAARAAATAGTAADAVLYGSAAATALAQPLPPPALYNEAHVLACEGDAEDLRDFIDEYDDEHQRGIAGSELAPFHTADHLGNTPLHYACGEVRRSTVEVLLGRKSPCDVQNFEGKTPLQLVAASAEADAERIVSALLAAGARVNIADLDGATALHAAAANNAAGICAQLLANGAWVDAADNEGDTPLIYAVRDDAVDAVRQLLSAGASPFVANVDGETAMDLASYSDPKISALLEAAACDRR